MGWYRVRQGYTVHVGRRAIPPGMVFEPAPEVLANQGWKLEPVEPETREIARPVRDRALKGPKEKK